jgi:squalene-hopene/tetraprenyl-beta-curcumene cyclase
MAAGLDHHPAVARGVRWLLDTQRDDGTWDEPEFVGTGFPQVFYLRYHMYPIYFPLMALSRWATAIGSLFQEADAACQRLTDTAAPGRVHH